MRRNILLSFLYKNLILNSRNQFQLSALFLQLNILPLEMMSPYNNDVYDEIHVQVSP